MSAVPPAAGRSLRRAAMVCLVVWAAIWLLYLAMRVGTFDYRRIPGIGPFLLTSLATVLMAPMVATALSIGAVVRGRAVLLNWVTLGGSVAALFGQGFVFVASRYL